MKLKIAIVVPGRFHAFDLARELINQGHDVTLFTNYPKKIVEKFGIPRQNVRSFLLHGIFTRVIHQLHIVLNTPRFEAFFHVNFSRWAAGIIVKNDYDVVQVFSGVAEDIFQALSSHSALKILVRASAHIRTQLQILLEEEQPTGLCIEKPSSWMVMREEREYQLANVILLLSNFAKQSFIAENCALDKLKVIPLGTELKRFTPAIEIIETRCNRIINEPALRVLTVGTFSYRKGAKYLIKIAESCSKFCQFKFVGAISTEAIELAQKSQGAIEFIPKQPQFELPQLYAWADIFIFPTIEDGYPVVLSQAQAAGLPILVTTNCSGPDIIVDGETGWVLPIRSPESFVKRLEWCHEHRQELAKMVWRVYQDFQPRDWADVATDFVNIYADLLQNKQV